MQFFSKDTKSEYFCIYCEFKYQWEYIWMGLFAMQTGLQHTCIPSFCPIKYKVRVYRASFTVDKDSKFPTQKSHLWLTHSFPFMVNSLSENVCFWKLDGLILACSPSSDNLLLHLPSSGQCYPLARNSLTLIVRRTVPRIARTQDKVLNMPKVWHPFGGTMW